MLHAVSRARPMEWTDKIIIALSTAFSVSLLAIGRLIVKLRQSRTGVQVVENSESLKTKRANAKIEDERRRSALEEWRELYNQSVVERNQIRKEVDALNEHRRLCEIELSAVKTQLHELLEWKSSLESSG